MIRVKRFGLLLSSLLLIGCSTVKYVPVQKTVKEYVRDTIVLRPDTIRIELEKERFKEVLPEIDTSILETSLSRSVAFLDTARREIHHTLEHKDTVIKKEIVFKDKIVYKDRIIEKEIPVEVRVPEPFIPKWVKWTIFISIGLFLLISFLYFRF